MCAVNNIGNGIACTVFCPFSGMWQWQRNFDFLIVRINYLWYKLQLPGVRKVRQFLQGIWCIHVEVQLKYCCESSGTICSIRGANIGKNWESVKISRTHYCCLEFFFHHFLLHIIGHTVSLMILIVISLIVTGTNLQFRYSQNSHKGVAWYCNLLCKLW